MRFTILFVLFTCLLNAQEKALVYYNENGKNVTQDEFRKAKNSKENLDIYFENDTSQIGILVTRKNYGKLDKKTFDHLKSYLTEISQKKVDPTENLVINYLTLYPTKDEISDYSNSKSNWNILDRNYTKKLHKIANINQFFIHTPGNNTHEYYRNEKINWIKDKNNLFNKLFFPYEILYGNFILIKPNGEYFYYLGESGKQTVWSESEKFFKS